MNTFIILTPPGHGAIGVIRVQGETCAACVDAFFTSTRGISVCDAPCERVLYGKIQEEDVVLCKTSEDVVEIHCHGSPVAIRRIAGLLEQHGVTEISREDFLKQQYADTIQTLAGEMLSRAPTWRISRIILDQYNGALQKAILNIDRESDANRQADLRRELFRWSDIAQHLLTPWKIALVGPPNAGKSSLFNALAGFSRVLVHDEAGTTRDIVRETVVLDGWCFELIDTAGLRDLTDDDVEKEGIRRTRGIMEEADLILYVQDVTASKPAQADKIPLPEDKTVLYVWNKCDLCRVPPDPSAYGTNALFVSAKDENHIRELARRILETIIPVDPPPGTAVPIGLV